MTCPRRGAARQPSAQNSAAGRRRQTQTKRQTNITTHSITRTRRLVDSAAILALDMAAIAGKSGRAHHARAALRLRNATNSVWLAAEALAEEACA
jgi:hypothetical protein